MIKISNCRETTGNSFAALSRISSSFCKTEFLDYGITSNIAKVKGFPGSFWFSSSTFHVQKNQQDIHTRERGRSTRTSRASSRLRRRAHVIAFLSNTFKLCMISILLFWLSLKCIWTLTGNSPQPLLVRWNGGSLETNGDSHFGCRSGIAFTYLFFRKPKAGFLTDN